MTRTNPVPPALVTPRGLPCGAGEVRGTPVVLAFLQNQWFRDPVRAQAIYDRHAGDWRRRAALNARYLFAGSLTGQRLKAAFGDMCGSIVWEEASPRKAGLSSGAFPADPEHIAEAVKFWRPSLILTFGRIASDGLADFADCPVVKGPHPAARHGSVTAQLREMADFVRSTVPGTAARGAAGR